VVSGLLMVTVASSDAYLASLQLLIDGLLLASSPVSPLTAPIDTTLRLDGAMVVTAVVTDLAGNQSRCAATVTVDNVAFALSPRTLDLRSRGGANSVTARLEGVNVALLLPTSMQGLELRVPGGRAVAVTADFAPCGDDDNDNVPELTLKFDRQALIAAIRAGITAGLIDAGGTVKVTLMAGGQFAIGSDLVRIVGS